MHELGERPWYRVWPEGMPKNLEYPEITLQELLTRSAEKYPDRPFLSFYGRSVKYKDLDRAADRFAAGLQQLRVRRGDRVSLLLPNTPHYPIAFFGALKAGALVVQTSPLYTPRELEAQYKDSGAETAIVMDLFWHNFAAAKPATPVQRAIVCHAAEFLGAPQKWLYPLRMRTYLKKAGQWPLRIPQEPWVHRFSDIASVSGPPREVKVGTDDPAVLQYTGGTTGVPKAAVLTHRNLIATAHQMATVSGIRVGIDRAVIPIPLFHIYGVYVMLMGILRGAEAVLEPNPRDTNHIIELIRKTKPSVFVGVPTLFIAMLNNPKAEVSIRGIKDTLSGGAPLPSEVRRKWEAMTGGSIHDGFGLTEASVVTAQPTTKSGVLALGVGIPLPDTDIRIVDLDTGTTDMPLGEPGEAIVKGPQVMKEYWNRPEDTAVTLRNGWLYTGDVCKMDENGIIYVVERKKDMIDASGFKVYPQEVEEVLYGNPAVVEAAVVGVPDPYRGQTVKAFIVIRPGSTVTQEDISGYCRERLAPYKVPRQIEFIPTLPKSVVGKVLRRALREKSQRTGASAAAGRADD